MKRRAHYEFVAIASDHVVIEDRNGPLSVTNDAENVVAELLSKFGNKRIFYYDTMGNRDELCHDGKKFTHFAPART